MLTGLGFAFVSGVLVMGSPCTLPILPGLLATLGVARGRGGPAGGGRPLRQVLPAVVFATGVAVALAATAGVGVWLARGLALWRPPLSLVPALLLAVAGLAALDWKPLAGLRWKPLEQRRRSSPTAILTGLGLGAGWAPCATPALGTAMLAASHADSFLVAVALLTSYVVGVVLPVTAVAVGVTSLRPVRRFLNRAGAVVQRASGAALLLLSLLVATGLWERVGAQLLGALS